MHTQDDLQIAPVFSQKMDSDQNGCSWVLFQETIWYRGWISHHDGSTDFSFYPLETIGIFAYVRWFGSIRGYTLLILAVSIGINYLIAKWLIARIKATPLAENTIAEYEQMSQGARKHLYSFMPVAEVVFCTSIMPWLLLGIAVFVICVVFPH